MNVVFAHSKFMRAIEVIGIRVAPTLVGQAYRELRCLDSPPSGTPQMRAPQSRSPAMRARLRWDRTGQHCMVIKNRRYDGLRKSGTC